MTSTLPCGMLGSVASLLASTLYEGKHKVLNIASIEGYVCKTHIDAQPLRQGLSWYLFNSKVVLALMFFTTNTLSLDGISFIS
jgi:hypothetical protein